jgi:hypothetical protein
LGFEKLNFWNFWGPQKRFKFWILDLKVCLKKLGIGSGLYGKSVLYLGHSNADCKNLVVLYFFLIFSGFRCRVYIFVDASWRGMQVGKSLSIVNWCKFGYGIISMNSSIFLLKSTHWLYEYYCENKCCLTDKMGHNFRKKSVMRLNWLKMSITFFLLKDFNNFQRVCWFWPQIIATLFCPAVEKIP